MLKSKLASQGLRWLFLLLIPTAWCGASRLGWLTKPENRTIDWRFEQRGPIEAPVKIVYVCIDDISLERDSIGGWPWSRSYFAVAAQTLIEKGGARAVGFDFVFSPLGQSETASEEKIKEGDDALRRYVIVYPPKVPPRVAFAASYTADYFSTAEGTIAKRGLPRVAEMPLLPDPKTRREAPERTEIVVPTGTARPPNLGLIDTIDGGARTVPAWAWQTKEGDFFHLSLELVRLFWGLPIDGMKPVWSRKPTPTAPGVVERIDMTRDDGTVVGSIPLRNSQDVDVNWFLPWDSPANDRESFLAVYAYAEALHPDPTDDPAQIKQDAEDKKKAEEFFANDRWKNAIVLIGPTAQLLKDVSVTPVDETPVPRVSVHGNLIKTIISGQYLKFLPAGAVDAITIGLTLLVSLFAAAGGTGGRLSKLTAVLILIAYVWLCFALFGLPDTFLGVPLGPVKNYHIILPVVAPIGAVFSTSFAAIIWALIEEEKQKGRIKGMFGTYLSPQLVSRMVESGEDPQLGGHEEEITAYFSDIQSFSSFSEKLPPARLVELMNEYLTACTDIVQAQGGTLDKYIGDAVVAMFGAPFPLEDHAARACIATQLVHQKLGELRDKWKEEGEKWPEIVKKMQSRIGLNSGMATIGNMGSRSRFNYTMMGDNVNLAARMESGAKSWGAYTMVTDATRVSCQKFDQGRVIFRPLGRIVVMGRSQPVPIFEIVGLKESVPASALECISIFAKGLEAYYAREWDAAILHFKHSADLEPNQPGKTPGVKLNPSLVYLNITEDYRAEPPAADWDGVYVMKEK